MTDYDHIDDFPEVYVGPLYCYSCQREEGEVELEPVSIELNSNYPDGILDEVLMCGDCRKEK